MLTAASRWIAGGTKQPLEMVDAGKSLRGRPPEWMRFAKWVTAQTTGM